MTLNNIYTMIFVIALLLALANMALCKDNLDAATGYLLAAVVAIAGILVTL